MAVNTTQEARIDELTQGERIEIWREVTEDLLIAAYVPEADQMSRKDALQLALERDLKGAITLENDAMLHLEAAAEALKD